MSYKIRVYYYVGDSFGSVDRSDELHYNWDKVTAEENLKRINEHARWYAADNLGVSRYSLRNPVPKPAYVHEEMEWVLKLKLNEGKEFLYGAEWIDCFNGLLHAEIVDNNPPPFNGLKFK